MGTVLGFNGGKASAMGFYCSSGASQCADAQFHGTSQYVESSSVYFSAGQTIIYEWENTNSSIMQVSFQVYNSNGNPVGE